MPLAFVVAAAPVTLPPPEATAKVTLTPETGLFCASRTITEGGVATAVPRSRFGRCRHERDLRRGSGRARCREGHRAASEPAEVAVSVLAPAVVPSVQLPTVAMRWRSSSPRRS